MNETFSKVMRLLIKQETSLKGSEVVFVNDALEIILHIMKVRDISSIIGERAFIFTIVVCNIISIRQSYSNKPSVARLLVYRTRKQTLGNSRLT